MAPVLLDLRLELRPALRHSVVDMEVGGQRTTARRPESLGVAVFVHVDVEDVRALNQVDGHLPVHAVVIERSDHITERVTDLGFWLKSGYSKQNGVRKTEPRP